MPRVTPALSPVTARFAPLNALMSALLPVLGMPATISRGGREMPFAASFANLSASSCGSFAVTARAAPADVALHFAAGSPRFAKAERKASVFLSSARSALLRR